MKKEKEMFPVGSKDVSSLRDWNSPEYLLPK